MREGACVCGRCGAAGYGTAAVGGSTLLCLPSFPCRGRTRVLRFCLLFVVWLLFAALRRACVWLRFAFCAFLSSVRCEACAADFSRVPVISFLFSCFLFSFPALVPQRRQQPLRRPPSRHPLTARPRPVRVSLPVPAPYGHCGAVGEHFSNVQVGLRAMEAGEEHENKKDRERRHGKRAAVKVNGTRPPSFCFLNCGDPSPLPPPPNRLPPATSSSLLHFPRVCLLRLCVWCVVWWGRGAGLFGLMWVSRCHSLRFFLDLLVSSLLRFTYYLARSFIPSPLRERATTMVEAQTRGARSLCLPLSVWTPCACACLCTGRRAQTRAVMLPCSCMGLSKEEGFWTVTANTSAACPAPLSPLPHAHIHLLLCVFRRCHRPRTAAPQPPSPAFSRWGPPTAPGSARLVSPHQARAPSSKKTSKMSKKRAERPAPYRNAARLSTRALISYSVLSFFTVPPPPPSLPVVTRATHDCGCVCVYVCACVCLRTCLTRSLSACNNV